MLKEAAGIAGGALLLPPLGLSIVACGLPGLLMVGAGLFVVDAVMKGRASGEREGHAGEDPENDTIEDRLSNPFSPRARH